jgi:hypothetical protein
MKHFPRVRWLWAWIATALLTAIVVQLAPPVRATTEWHLRLNDVNTTDGGTCGGSYLNPWDGTDDYLFGTYYDTANSGLTFSYSYNSANWESPGSPFGDQQPSPPSYLYLFSDGSGGDYQIPTWTHGIPATHVFTIHPVGGSGADDFVCYF